MPAAERELFKFVYLEPNWNSVGRLCDLAACSRLAGLVQSISVHASPYVNLSRIEWEDVIASYRVADDHPRGTLARYRDTLTLERIDARYQNFRYAIKNQNMLLLGLSPHQIYSRLLQAFSGLPRLTQINRCGSFYSKYLRSSS